MDMHFIRAARAAACAIISQLEPNAEGYCYRSGTIDHLLHLLQKLITEEKKHQKEVSKYVSSETSLYALEVLVEKLQKMVGTGSTIDNPEGVLDVCAYIMYVFRK